MKLTHLLVALLGSFFTTQVFAADNIKFNGFASVVSGIDLKDENADSDYNSQTFDNLPESRLALQMTAKLEDGVRFIGQAVARGDSEEGFISNYEWAYFDFNVGSAGKLKFGRVRVPFYKYSDYLDVGFAYHWIKPPEAQYAISFRNADGLSYSHNFQLGPLDNTLSALYGRYQGSLTIGGQASPGEIRNLTGLRWLMNAGNNEFYASYWQGDCTIDSSVLTATAAALAPAGVVGEDVIIEGDLCYFYGGGYKGTFGDFGLHAEAGTIDVEDAAYAAFTGAFVGGTYQMGDYLLHLTYEMTTLEEEEYDPIPTALESTGGEITNIIVGVRKDIGFSSAVKFEVHQYDTSEGYKPANVAAADNSSDDEYSATIVKVAFDTMF